MKLYFIRHGIAEVFADSDSKRELTLEGRIKLNDTFREFKKFLMRRIMQFILLLM